MADTDSTITTWKIISLVLGSSVISAIIGAIMSPISNMLQNWQINKQKKENIIYQNKKEALEMVMKLCNEFYKYTNQFKMLSNNKNSDTVKEYYFELTKYADNSLYIDEEILKNLRTFFDKSEFRALLSHCGGTKPLDDDTVNRYINQIRNDYKDHFNKFRDAAKRELGVIK